MASSAIMWADSDYEDTPERQEAIAAVTDILAMLNLHVGGTVLEKAIQRVIAVQGVAERKGYDLGWSHCADAIGD